MIYKESEFGKIPEHWNIHSTFDYCKIITDYVANGSFKSLADNVNYNQGEKHAVLIRLTDYHNGFKGEFVHIDKKAYDFLGKTKLYGGEIIIANVGANVGTVFLVPRLKVKMSLGPNSIMIKTKGNDKIRLYMAKDILGSQFDQLNFSELKEIFLKEPKKRETEIKFSSWGLPFSYITKIPFNNKIKKENVYSNFLEFFDQNNELKNIGAINYLSKNIIEICKKIKIERRNYDCIDIFLFLYDFCLIQKRQVEFLKLSDLIEIINCILQNIELCKLLYARYIFKDDENYLIKIKERFDTIQIKYLELYDKMKANSQRFKKLI